MKKKVLKLTFFLFTVVLVFSSCLGDTENKIEISDDYGCIISDLYGQRNAIVSSVGYVYASEFESLQEGTIINLSYKIIGAQSSSVPTLQEVYIKKKYIPSEQAGYTWSTPPAESEKEAFPTSLSTVGNAWSPLDIFLDRWTFAPIFNAVEGTKIQAHFYYDADRQQESNGELTENRLILDVRFTADDTEVTNTVNKTYVMVANFKGIRSLIEGLPQFKWGVTSLSEGGTPVYVQFRYRVQDGSVPFDKYKEATLGSGSDYQFIMSKSE